MNPNSQADSPRRILRSFIKEQLTYGLDDDIDPDADLIEQGVIDSMSLLRLINFLEERFSIEVRDEDLVPDNFRSLAAIEGFLKRFEPVN